MSGRERRQTRNIYAVTLGLLVLVCVLGQEQDQEEAACLKVLNPSPYYGGAEELDSLVVQLLVECDWRAKGVSLAVDINGQRSTSLSTIDDTNDFLGVKILFSWRQVYNLGFALTREDESVDTANMTFILHPLVEPSLAMTFPPEGFVFEGGADPFIVTRVSDSPSITRKYGPPSYKLRVTLWEVDGIKLQSILGSESNNQVLGRELLLNLRHDIDQIWELGNHTGPKRLHVRVELLTQDERMAFDSAGVQIVQERTFVYDRQNVLPPVVRRRDFMKCKHNDQETRPSLEAEALFLTDVQHLHRNIRAVIAPSDQASCSTALRFSADISSGFGTNMRAMALAIARSISLGRVLTFDPDWKLLKSSDCPTGTLDCYFEDSFKCNPNLSTSTYERPVRAHEVQPPIKVSGKANNLFELVHPPKPFEYRSTFWFLAHTLDYILRPNPHLTMVLTRARNYVGFRHPVIGLHARQGDSCHKGTGRVCFAASEYVEQIETMRSAYKVTNVFVSTDSRTLMQELKHLSNGIHFFYLDSGISEELTQGDFPPIINPVLRARMGLMDVGAVNEATFIDLLLLRECDYFIGQFSSTFSILALELSAARKGYIPPYIGMDGPWQSLLN